MKTRAILMRSVLVAPAIFLAGFLTSCAPQVPNQASEPPTVTPETSPTVIVPTPQPTNTAVLACPQAADKVLLSAQESTYAPNTDDAAAAANRADSLTLVTYQVRGDQINDPLYESIPDSLKSEQEDSTSQRQAWRLFATLIPLEDRQMIAQYQAFTDGPGRTLSAVQQIYGDPRKWIVELDVEDVPDKLKLIFALLHEYGHLLTLGASQVPPDISVLKYPDNKKLYDEHVAACPTYYTTQGCSKPDSYVNQFYERFWNDLMDEWQKIHKPLASDSPDQYNGRMFSFYQKHSDQFVDDYGITSPVEDVAESFAFFVLSQPPKGDQIKDQKILFFYEYPELVRLRSRILANLCSVQ